MRNWQPVDYLVCGLVLILVIVFSGLVAATLARGTEMDADRADMVGDIVEGIRVLVGVYIGAKLQQVRDSNDIDTGAK